MRQYVGLDVAMDETKVHILDGDGKRVWRGKCRSHPDDIEAVLHQRAPQAERIGLETGPLTTWLWTELTGRGLPMVCLDARHAKRALDMRPNKTDANDAEGLAYIVRSGWYREVRVKGSEAMLSKALAGARGQLTTMVTDLSNQIPHEDIWVGRPERQRGRLRAERPRPSRWRRGHRDRRHAFARRLAAGATARCRARPPPPRCRTRELRVSIAHDHAQHRRRHRGFVRRRNRASGELHPFAERRCLARPDAAPVPVRRNRLPRPHLQTRRQPFAGAPLRGSHEAADARPRGQPTASARSLCGGWRSW